MKGESHATKSLAATTPQFLLAFKWPTVVYRSQGEVGAVRLRKKLGTLGGERRLSAMRKSGDEDLMFKK